MTWWRRNRWALVLLLPALALALAASGVRLQLFWWSYEPHQPTSGALGRPMHFVDHAAYDTHPYVLDVTVTVRSVTRVAVPVSPGHEWTWPTPDGARWWKVTMQVAADPTTPLSACRLRLLGAAGDEVDYTSRFPGTADTLPVSPCVPDATPGPGSASPEDLASAATAARPASYEVSAYVLASGDFRPSQVRLWWWTPRYVSVDLPGS